MKNENDTLHPQQIVPAYRLSVEKVLSQLGSTKQGLGAHEATARLEQYGYNQLEEISKESLFRKVSRQFKDPMIILLLASAIIAVYLKDNRTASILVTIVAINIGISFWQEFKAENIMSSLEKLVVPTAKVLRGGKLEEVPTSEIVPGDILYLTEGDSVPADARVMEENELSTNDFALTGESNPSRKFARPIEGTVELPMRHNLVFMGTTVATGDAYCIVTGTGMLTELGRIARLSQSTKQDLSPLQKEMNHLTFTITKGTIIMAVILGIVVIKAGLSIHDAFVFAIGIASAMTPQGLPAEVNTALTSAAGRLAKAKALVKKLSAVESLGSTSIICTDKTGTLTKNEMTVQQLYIGGQSFWVSGTGYQGKGSILDNKQRPVPANSLKEHELFFATGVFASNATVHPPDEKHGNWYTLGDPTEGALITLAQKAGLNDEKLNKSSPELQEFTFDSVRKRMSSIRNFHGKLHVFTKGAPEGILEVCTHILVEGKVRKITRDDKHHIKARNELLASGAMRNLAFAYKTLPDSNDLKNLPIEKAESELIFLGLASMIDPPRDEIPEAMLAAARANIPVTIITGDNALTASAIAIKAGLATKASELKIVLGSELRNMEKSQIIHLLNRGQVIFSRVAPEDKLRIVDLAKAAKKVVAVTGDGINDAPALKRADIGVAMGITGTDVAKQSAEIILLDDSFHTLVGAIQQGRIIFQNIKKAALSCLTSNTGELFTVLISLAAISLFDIPIAITAVLILAIDLVAELFPIAALGWDGPDGELMEDPPRDPHHHILSPRNILDLALSGVLIGILAYSNFLFFFERNGLDPVNFSTNDSMYASAVTLTYVTIVLCQFGNILARRTRTYRQSFFSSYLWHNKQLLFAFGLSLACVLTIVYVPFMQNYLASGPLNTTDWLLALSCALIYLVVRWLTIHRLHKTA